MRTAKTLRNGRVFIWEILLLSKKFIALYNVKFKVYCSFIVKFCLLFCCFLKFTVIAYKRAVITCNDVAVVCNLVVTTYDFGLTIAVGVYNGVVIVYNGAVIAYSGIVIESVVGFVAKRIGILVFAVLFKKIAKSVKQHGHNG